MKIDPNKLIKTKPIMIREFHSLSDYFTVSLFGIKRKIQKIGIKTLRLMNVGDNSEKHYPYSRHAISICRHLLKLSDTTLLMSPISQKRYIRNDGKGLFVIIVDDNITVVNHVYRYTIGISGKTYETIRDMFDNHVEKLRQEMEKEITKNVIDSLKDIYINLKNEKV